MYFLSCEKIKTTLLYNHVPRPNRGGSAVRASGVHYLFHGTVTNIRISKKRMVKLEMFDNALFPNFT